MLSMLLYIHIMYRYVALAQRNPYEETKTKHTKSWQLHTYLLTCACLLAFRLVG